MTAGCFTRKEYAHFWSLSIAECTGVHFQEAVFLLKKMLESWVHINNIDGM